MQEIPNYTCCIPSRWVKHLGLRQGEFVQWKDGMYGHHRVNLNTHLWSFSVCVYECLNSAHWWMTKSSCYDYICAVCMLAQSRVSMYPAVFKQRPVQSCSLFHQHTFKYLQHPTRVILRSTPVKGAELCQEELRNRRIFVWKKVTHLQHALKFNCSQIWRCHCVPTLRKKQMLYFSEEWFTYRQTPMCHPPDCLCHVHVEQQRRAEHATVSEGELFMSTRPGSRCSKVSSQI